MFGDQGLKEKLLEKLLQDLIGMPSSDALEHGSDKPEITDAPDQDADVSVELEAEPLKAKN
jgi:hypothetical protein